MQPLVLCRILFLLVPPGNALYGLPQRISKTLEESDKTMLLWSSPHEIPLPKQCQPHGSFESRFSCMVMLPPPPPSAGSSDHQDHWL